ncbi:hypothetical protein H6F43_04095 [Leptolyngbya sp. FACHB-36]|uniref:hypothetical protein n=1 Tax=Leptolyngbya sp. FACHB-36 TaxID=2692808 RepID=UPI0016815212|nr:hypothetical protein [Leptolyngbya sp. FACHB-36]MBD2019364.1 hypothetical protein [Leptolyngbya sp. FACHB-36]
MDSNLFPTEYSNLCPSTQVEEVDRVTELEQKLLILRHQHLLETKKQGQSIAELQNTTLIIGNMLFPSPTIARSYLAGGEELGIHGQIDKFFHASEQIAAQSFGLTQARHRHAATASSAKGYWAGGETNYSATKTANVEALVFETEAKANVAASLSTPTGYFRGVQSATKGYFAGSIGPDSGKIEAITFSSEAIALLGVSLPSVIGGSTAVQSATKGYFGSGWNNTRNINTLVFSSETTANLSAQLTLPRLEGGQFASGTTGYFVAGCEAVTFVGTQTIDRILFATEACTLVANALASYPEADMDGTGGMRKGYSWGGVTIGRRYIDGFDFASETMAPIGSQLSRGGRYITPATKL